MDLGDRTRNLQKRRLEGVMSGEGSVYLAHALSLADKAREISLGAFRRLGEDSIESKSGASEIYDPVTRADKEIESLWRAMIGARFPSHEILGEEMGRAEREGGSAFEWILDPLDGTRNFISGALYWTSLAGLRERGRPLVGVCDHPLTDERFFATREEGAQGGAWLEKEGSVQRIETRACESLASAVLGTTTPNIFLGDGEWEAFDALQKQTRMQIFGGNSYFYGLLAMGFLDIVIESSLTIFDVQPLIPIVEEAGGVMTDWRGSPPQAGGKILACGDKRLHATIIPLLESAA